MTFVFVLSSVLFLCPLLLLLCGSPLPPRIAPTGRLGPVVGYWCLPPGICCSWRRLGCLALCLGCRGALFPLFVVSRGSKGLWPCVGIYPSTPRCMRCWGSLCSVTEVFICGGSRTPCGTPLRHSCTVQETNWDAQREKACVNAHASASQICLQNICGQQQNFPMAGPTFGSKSGTQNGAQAKT